MMFQRHELQLYLGPALLKQRYPRPYKIDFVLRLVRNRVSVQAMPAVKEGQNENRGDKKPSVSGRGLGLHPLAPISFRRLEKDFKDNKDNKESVPSAFTLP